MQEKFPGVIKGDETFGEWISLKSRGGLTHPTVEVLNMCDMFSKQFENFHGNYINKEPKPLEKLEASVKSEYPKMNETWRAYALSLYIKIWFFNRIKMLNNALNAEQNHEEKRRLKQIGQHLF